MPRTKKVKTEPVEEITYEDEKPVSINVRRERTVKNLSQLLVVELDEMTEEIIYNIEKGIFNASLTKADQENVARNWEEPCFCNIYNDLSYCVFSNLKRNKSLREEIKKEKIKPQHIGFLKPEQLDPEGWEHITSKNMDCVKNAYEVKMESMTKNVKCGRCKGNRIFYQEVQTRSADEPMTTFYQCLDCGKKWKH